MKHHLYQIYIGGFKEKFYSTFYCKDCGYIITRMDNKDLKVINHKHHHKIMTEKQSGNP